MTTIAAEFSDTSDTSTPPETRRDASAGTPTEPAPNLQTPPTPLPLPDSPATPEPDPDAPFGWMDDPVTGERRPKKRPGRTAAAPPLPSGTSPTLEELKGRQRASGAEDTAPSAERHRRGVRGRRVREPKPPVAAPPFRAGPIAKGMNKLYAKAGKIITIWDPEVGQAVIACTRKADEDDTTVGEAWEEIAKTNPRIRVFLLRLVSGGQWGSLVMAHLPIFLAIAMKESIRSRLPFVRIADAFLTDDSPDGSSMPSGMAQAMGGMTADDMSQMMQAAQAMMGQMAMGMPRGMNDAREATQTIYVDES